MKSGALIVTMPAVERNNSKAASAQAASSVFSQIASPLVRAQGIGKSFAGIQALVDLDLEIRHGEVHALLGDNGAGKSTFVKILSGAFAPTSGTLIIDDHPVSFHSPQDALHAGIATIFQELALSENLSVVENVYLGREIVRRVLGFPFLQRSRMRQRVTSLLEELDAHLPNPDVLIGSLSGGQRQAAAICRALNLEAKLVIMDEPTAALAVAETRKVLALIRRLASRGCAVLLISHNISDVFQVADRMTIFRRGRKIVDLVKEETTPEEVVAYITGAHASLMQKKEPEEQAS